MRQKERKLVVTFSVTADAMALEKACREQGIPGRMIPIPRNLSAGCGLSWSTDPRERERIEKVLREEHIEADSVSEEMV